MNVYLFNVSDNPVKVNKIARLEDGVLVENVRFKDKDALNVMTPTLILDINSELVQCVKFNYVYIPKTTRYYFITNISTEGALISIETRVDVLMSFKKDILNSTQYILRQENKYTNPFLVDTMLPIKAEHNYLATPFGDAVDDRTCGRVILETAGMGGRVI